jgi:Sulfotransferase domain
MSAPKEPQFFARDFLGDRRRILGLEEYLDCFAGAKDEQVVGEASTAYFASEIAPREIKAFAPAARIIIMVRNPVDKMYSRFNDARFTNMEHHVSFEAALNAERAEGPSFGLGYRESSRYAQRVQRYLSIFGRENVHVIVYDDFKERTRETYQETLRFLNVRPDTRSYFPTLNSAKTVRSMRLQEFVRSPPKVLKEVARIAMPQAMRRRLRDLFSSANVLSAPRPPLDPGLRRQMQREFQDDVEQLGSLIGRDLSYWSNG